LIASPVAQDARNGVKHVVRGVTGGRALGASPHDHAVRGHEPDAEIAAAQIDAGSQPAGIGHAFASTDLK
jgi:hypothetical protein